MSLLTLLDLLLDRAECLVGGTADGANEGGASLHECVQILARDDHLVIVWTERGGRPVAAPPGPAVFGRLVFRSLAGQLGGSIAYDRPIAGVVITLRMSKARLTT